MVHDRPRVGFAEIDPRPYERILGRAPGAMDMRRLEPGELWNPAAHISSAGIELLRLQDRIEDAEEGCRVGARARDPLPIHRIAGRIGVAERVPEPFLAAPPVDKQVLDEKRGRDKTDAIVHEASAPELPH